MKRKKFISTAILIVMLLSLSVTNVYASSYPTVYPDIYDLYVQKGSYAVLSFTSFQKYNNEKCHVNIYKGDSVNGTPIFSEEQAVYSNNSIAEIKFWWNTANAECGTYTVEYYMSFYTYFEWHTAPIKSSLMKIHVFKPGEVMTSVLSTDVKAFIDNRPIESYNIDGNTVVSVEDLANYGFQISYDNIQRTLKIKDIKGTIMSNYMHNTNTSSIGKKLMNVYYTDIKTYVQTPYSTSINDSYERQISKTYNVNGKTFIKIDDIDCFNRLGTTEWNAEARTISYTRK